MTLLQNGSQLWTGSDVSIASGNAAFNIPSNADTVSDAVMGAWAGGNFVGGLLNLGVNQGGF